MPAFTERERTLKPTGDVARGVKLSKFHLLALVGLLYLALFVGLDFLRFAPRLDEVHFWPTALSFSTSYIPTLDQLRDYGEVSTPLPFVVFGGLEHLLHGGIMIGRLLNLLLSCGMTCLVVLAGRDARRAALATAGLLIFPYYLGVSVHLYTDVIAAAFVLLGLILAIHQRAILSALCFALAIASRQYAVAFPVAVAAYQLHRGRTRPASPIRWIAPLLSAGTLAGWYWLFGGPAPAATLADQGVDANLLRHIDPSHAIYLLTCVGLFYVIPESVLFPDKRRTWRPTRGIAYTVLATMILTFIFAPLGNSIDVPTMGLFDRLVGSMLAPGVRCLLYGALAALAVVRFSRYSLAALLVAANAGVLLLSFVMWEKYALPLLVCLWYLKAREESPPALSSEPILA